MLANTNDVRVEDRDEGKGDESGVLEEAVPVARRMTAQMVKNRRIRELLHRCGRNMASSFPRRLNVYVNEALMCLTLTKP